MSAPEVTTRWPVPDRSVLATVLGVPPLVAVAVAAGFTGLGVFVDLARIGRLGLIFTVCYVVGCLLPTAWVRRSGLFWPMVAPPLLLAAAVPVVVLLTGTPKPGAGIAERTLVIGAPLVNAFPTMAWTTGLVLALGLARIVVQREPAQREPSPRAPSPREPSPREPARRQPAREERREPARARPDRTGVSVPHGPGAAPGAARTSRSPRPS